MFTLDNPIRHYAWGSATALPQFLARPGDGTPWAECWLGAHPASPSSARAISRGRGEPAEVEVSDQSSARSAVTDLYLAGQTSTSAPSDAGGGGGLGGGEAGDPVGLDTLIAADPATMLGAPCAAAFGPRLPYLLKLIAPARPLSIQVHPDAERARQGYRDGVYLDPYPKPEMLLALTPFDFLAGLRPLTQIADIVRTLAVPTLTRTARPILDAAGGPCTAPAARDALRAVFDGLLRLPTAEAQRLAAQVEARASELLTGNFAELSGSPTTELPAPERRADDPCGAREQALATAVETAADFPGDIGVVVSMLLRRGQLEPGQAVYIPAGTVHAYLGGGLGVEIMAASDNVVRSGLTPKAVNVEELLAIADFSPHAAPLVETATVGPVRTFSPGPAQFALDVIETTAGDTVDVVARGPRIVLVTDGRITVTSRDGQATVRRGESLFGADADGALRLSGDGRAVLARLRDA